MVSASARITLITFGVLSWACALDGARVLLPHSILPNMTDVNCNTNALYPNVCATGATYICCELGYECGVEGRCVASQLFARNANDTAAESWSMETEEQIISEEIGGAWDTAFYDDDYWTKDFVDPDADTSELTDYDNMIDCDDHSHLGDDRNFRNHQESDFRTDKHTAAKNTHSDISRRAHLRAESDGDFQPQDGNVLVLHTPTDDGIETLSII